MQDQPDDELVKDVFAHYGLAAYLAHVLERTLVNALTTVYGPGPTKLTRQQLDERLEELSQQGTGALLDTLRKSGLSEAVLTAVKAALSERERLTHQFFWKHAADFMTVEGCQRMIADLTETQRRFAECESQVAAEVHQWASAHGIKTSDFDAVQAAMLERGHVLDETEIEELLRSGGR
jgi:hypothetical protein